MNCRPFSRASALTAALVGASVLLGWWADQTVLKSLFPGLVEMNPATAVAFILSGAALWLLDARTRLSRILAGAVVLLACLKLLDCLTGWDLGADHLLFSAALDASPTGIPNRMAPNTAAAFLLLGASLLVLDPASPRRAKAAQVLALIVSGVAFLALLGYAYGAEQLYGVARFIPMAVNTAAAFLVLSAGVLCATAQAGLMCLLTEKSVAGATARRLLPMCILVPAAFGWLFLFATARGRIDLEFGASVLVTGIITIFIVVIYRAAGTLHRMEMQLEARVQDRTAELAKANAELRKEMTENVLLHAQLVQSQKMEAVGRLAGGVAHDFNNILTAIGGYCGFLLASLSPWDPMHADVEEIKKAGDKAASLTRQLLAFSRRQVLEPRVVDLSALAADMEKLLRRVVGEGVELRTLLPAGLGRVKCDPGQVEQVLLNLVINAKDAMPKGGRVTIETADHEFDADDARMHLQAPAGRYVMLSVSDTGTGMDEATLSHIFEPFFTTKEQGKGTGLGLATVFGIVKQSGGGISVSSDPGKGSVFTVYFPRVDDPLDAPHRPHPHSARDGGPECILLVEDDASVRKFLSRALSGLGYKVLTAGDPREAMALSDSHPERVDLLLSDVVMPQMHGPELAEVLVSKRPGMKVVFMSGYTEEGEDGKGVAEGAGFLQKPIGVEVLARKVREVLDGVG